MSRGPMRDQEIEDLREYLKGRHSNWQEMVSAKSAWRLILRIDRLRRQLTKLQEKTE